jgi:hypothetical protein
MAIGGSEDRDIETAGKPRRDRIEREEDARRDSDEIADHKPGSSAEQRRPDMLGIVTPVGDQPQHHGARRRQRAIGDEAKLTDHLPDHEDDREVQ